LRVKYDEKNIQDASSLLLDFPFLVLLPFLLDEVCFYDVFEVCFLDVLASSRSLLTIGWENVRCTACTCFNNEVAFSFGPWSLETQEKTIVAWTGETFLRFLVDRRHE
jgi:hypothetical protein